jgi:hypothetical protein
MDNQNQQFNSLPPPPSEPPLIAGSNASQNLPPSPSRPPRARYLIGTILILAAVALGFWVWQNQLGSPTSKLLPVEPLPVVDTNIEPPPTTATLIKTSLDPTDWKTYRNDEYGFEFKYPDWRIGDNFLSLGGTFQLFNFSEDQFDRVRFGIGENKIEMAISKNYSLAQLMEFDKEIEGENSFPAEVYSPLTIDGHQSLKRVSNTSISYLITLGTSDQGVLHVTIYGDKNNFWIIDKILSTFRFID